MDKVKLTQLQADALEAAIKDDGKASVITQHAIDNTDWCNACKGLNLMPLLTLVEALVNGYEVEQTPEDKVREFYQEQRSIVSTAQSPSPYAIKNVLNLLNIKIKDVND